MSARITGTSPLVYARVAGVLFIVMTILGPFSLVYVPSELVVPGDATATANNIMASQSLFHLGIIGHLVVLFADLGVAVLLYALLKPVGKTLALVGAAFRLIMVAIRGINLLNHFFALLLLSGADYLTVFSTDQLHALVLLFLNAFEDGVLIDLVFFGFHLIFAGYLVFRSGFLPRILGVLLVIAGIGYPVDSFMIWFLPNIDVSIVLFTFWGEPLLALWFLFRGVNVERWNERALEAA